MALQFSEVVEGIHGVQLAGVDQGHVEVTYVCAIQCLIEKRVLAMKNSFLQRAFNDVVVQWCAWNGDIVLLLVKTLKTLAG